MVDLIIPAEVDLTTAVKGLATDTTLTAATAFVAFLERAQVACSNADVETRSALDTAFVPVFDSRDCGKAKERILTLKDARKRVDEGMSPVTSEMHAAFMSLSGHKTGHLKALDSAISEQGGEIGRFDAQLAAENESLMPWESATEAAPKVEGLQERNTPWKVNFGTTPQERRLAIKRTVAKAAGVEVDKVDDGLIAYLDFNEAAVKDFAKRSGKLAEEIIPGILIYRDKIMARTATRKPKGGADVVKVVTLIPVESSQIKGIGYDPDTETLRVQFSSGSTYEYPNVACSTWTEFADAESKGKYFNAHIKGRNGAKV